MDFIVDSVFNISPPFHYALVTVCLSMARYRAERMNTRSVSNSYKATPTTLLSFGKAFTEFFPHITDMMTIMLCYVLIVWLVFPLHPVLQIFIVLILITAPFYYIPELMAMTPGIGVSCGSFNLPLIWFNVLGALSLTLIVVSVSLIVIYLIRRYIHPREPRVRERLNVSLDDLSEILTG